MDPLVSVVIPTFNRRVLVSEALRSALDQGHEPLEVIVVDDGSTDGTVAHLGSLGPPIRLVSIEHTGIIAKVRNVGIRQARGALLAFLDSDDLWLPGKLPRQVEYLRSHPAISVVYTNAYRQERGRVLERTRFDTFPPRSRVVYRDTLQGLCVQTSSVVLRREVLGTVGLFDEDLILYEDADMWSRISEEYELGFIDEPLVVYRPDADSIHIQDDPRLLVREARKYLARYEARRRGKARTEEELAATAKFVEALRRREAELPRAREAGRNAEGAPG